jgi:hypothetical protein
MREAKVVIDVIQRGLLPQPVLALAYRGDTPPHGGHMLTHRQVEALDKGCLDLPTTGR